MDDIWKTRTGVIPRQGVLTDYEALVASGVNAGRGERTVPSHGGGSLLRAVT